MKAKLSLLTAGILTAVIGTGFGRPIITTQPQGAVTSLVGTLAVLAPPSITKQPTNQSASLGASVTFSVLAAGATPLSYQWRFNEVDLPGKTNSSLVLRNLQ